MGYCKIYLTGLLFAACLGAFAKADCVPTPGCEEIGYRETACPSSAKILRCPFDTKKVKCVAGVSCGDGGYEEAVPANRKCTEVPFVGKTCYKDCYQPACEEGGYTASVPTNNKCTPVTYYGRTCQSSCYRPSCSEGGYKAAVPANNKCTAVNYFGQTCHKNCYQPTCEESGYLSAKPDGKICTSVSSYGNTCYKDCKVICAVGDIFYDDKTCSSSYINTKYPAGVVISVSDGGSHGKVMDLYMSSPMNWGCENIRVSKIPGIERSNIASALSDYNGKTYTSYIVEACGTNSAAGYCQNYSRGNLSGWYLPTAGELKNVMGTPATVTMMKYNREPPYWNAAEFRFSYWVSQEVAEVLPGRSDMAIVFDASSNTAKAGIKNSGITQYFYSRCLYSF